MEDRGGYKGSMGLIASYILLSLLAGFLLLMLVASLNREVTLAKASLIAAGGTMLFLVLLAWGFSLL